MGARAEKIGTEANHVAERNDVSEMLSQFEPAQTLETVVGLTREHPHAALATALGVGFLLGGGLTPRLIGAVGFMVARKYFRDTVAETLDGALRDEVFRRRRAS